MSAVEIPTPARAGGRRRVPWHRIQVTAGCWLWTGPVWKGYGHSGGTTAHRHVWLALGRTIPAGLDLDHLCRKPLCVNPDHLEPVTRAENARRRALALVTCVNGHDYTPENTYVRPDGTRDCRMCIRARVAKYRARRSARGAVVVAHHEVVDAPERSVVVDVPVPLLREGRAVFEPARAVLVVLNEPGARAIVGSINRSGAVGNAPEGPLVDHARTLSGVTR